jgi:hypothetical protein
MECVQWGCVLVCYRVGETDGNGKFSGVFIAIAKL